MNHTTKRSLRLSSMLLVGAALYMGACGPENLDDASYIDQLSDAQMIDGADQEAGHTPAAPADGDDKGMPEQRGGAPMVGAPVVAAPVIQLPDTFVAAPPQAVAQPPVIVNTREDVNFQRNVFHQQDVHVLQPTVEQHLVANHELVNDKFHTTVINHPTFSRNVMVTADAAEIAEVLPTTVVTEPVAVLPGAVAPIGPIGGIGCRPWLSGGFWRNCGNGAYPYGGPIPPYVVGPYFR
jgi:hypothetical protein